MFQFALRKGRAATMAAALALIANSAIAATPATINVGVAANFAGTMATLVAAFKAANAGWNVTYTVDSSSNLETAIINKTAKYDLFLSADTSKPWDLYYLSTAANPLIVGQPFFYAYGVLEFWSYLTTNNVSAGLPTSPAKFVIADPNKAPYGFAAGQVIQLLNGLTYISCSSALKSIPAGGTNAEYLNNTCAVTPGAPIGTAANIGTTYTAIKSGTYPYGFVAQSQICTLKAGVKTFATGSHHTYPYNTAPAYSRIKQDGIKVYNANRTAAAETELTAFIAYLSSTNGVNIIKSFCYDLI